MGISKSRIAFGMFVLGASFAVASVPTREIPDNEGRALFFRARLEGTRSLREETLVKALQVNEKEAAKNPADPETQFWRLSTLGELAHLRKNFWSLRVIRKLEGELNGYVARFPSHAFAGGYRRLGQLYQDAPRFISVGSTKKAEECYRRALALAPEFPGNHIALIDLLWQTGRVPEAKEVLANLMKMKGWAERQYGEFEPFKVEWETKVKTWLTSEKF